MGGSARAAARPARAGGGGVQAQAGVMFQLVPSLWEVVEQPYALLVFRAAVRRPWSSTGACASRWLALTFLRGDPAEGVVFREDSSRALRLRGRSDSCRAFRSRPVAHRLTRLHRDHGSHSVVLVGGGGAAENGHRPAAEHPMRPRGSTVCRGLSRRMGPRGGKGGVPPRRARRRPQADCCFRLCGRC